MDDNVEEKPKKHLLFDLPTNKAIVKEEELDVDTAKYLQIEGLDIQEETLAF